MNLTKIFATFLLAATIVFAQPKIEISGANQKDWGKVSPKDSPLSTKILIKNTGNQNLKITKVKPSCGCTSAPLEKNELLPNESTHVDVSFNVSGNTGNVTKTILIESNDPTNASINYLLKAEIVRPLTILPSTYMTFNTLQVGMEGESKLKIKNTSNSPISLLETKVEPDYLIVNLTGKKTLKPGEEFEIKVKVTPRKAGTINTKLSIKTTSEDFPVIDIFGYGRVAESPIFNNK